MAGVAGILGQVNLGCNRLPVVEQLKNIVLQTLQLSDQQPSYG